MMLAFLPMALGLVCALIFPLAGVLFCVLLLVLQFSSIASRIAVGEGSLIRLDQKASDVGPVFSVHVATHNEPAAMVIETRQALQAQNWPMERFEVIIIDNNTPDPALWSSVQAFCATLGKNFRFRHVMGVKGAKAGALNIALAHTRPDATHIVTVDADYRVEPQFLSPAA
jgi:cellulose synthase/poly-beta-1,6-N-acetylglucosamine synthase-like glycosyltransferase